ncbi:methyltransferase domain-containing protein [Synechococcales cyanobacterium C]|uniref:Methyltransferase domain-containing protein n=1 Tax=Petrachloros mirabilis ULC683 TaxID=2781853 RepID=A0A8K2A0B0_9CYAN|nr:class I SAM-dependent methyltransferase [Petrachloros mirabilis]NCJ08459.1 methyltransferase domain-containing protein [Petrachloros mirabilis ULC683]
MSIDTLNQLFYTKRDVILDYASQASLWPEETTIFEKFKSYIHDKSVLDLGCGGGRTTSALSSLTTQYIGLDYSMQMVEVCKSKYPHLMFLQGDASDMHFFEAEQFDFILFSFNGLDCMSHLKRVKTLSEVYRILKPKGVFAFSSHSRLYKGRVVFFDVTDFNPLHNIRNLLSYFKTRKYHDITNNYEILSDPLAGYGHLTYYIDKKDQVRQLEDRGFCNIDIINQKNQWIEKDLVDQESCWFHYICKKS